MANGLPAIVEASTDSVPMILLTADRPPELRQTGANQTIVQPNIFGEYTRWSFDLPAPDLSVDPASVLTTVDQACLPRPRNAPQRPGTPQPHVPGTFPGVNLKTRVRLSGLPAVVASKGDRPYTQVRGFECRHWVGERSGRVSGMS